MYSIVDPVWLLPAPPPFTLPELSAKDVNTDEIANKFLNLGGFHMIGSGRDKIATPE